MSPQLHVLCIDNYDSFVHTIVGYLKHCEADVTVIRNDDPSILSLVEPTVARGRNAGKILYEDASASMSTGRSNCDNSRGVVLDEDPASLHLPQHIDGVVVSPGPGTPSQAGYSPKVIRWCIDTKQPMLGVCLGHQGLGEVCGATVCHAPKIMHGKTSPVTHDGKGIFTGVPNPAIVARYHSLAVDPNTVPDELEVSAHSDDGMIMAFRHRHAPIETVQFHPESIGTDHGYQIIKNWVHSLV
ncbi:MAG: aminodeoxychorismate/anthranilate synthase component II [Actinomycetaceae bacterium]|nr:aminodeoxychorismate/anthranilate synthase component II [Actinomycetaceae bacterium]